MRALSPSPTRDKLRQITHVWPPRHTERHAFSLSPSVASWKCGVFVQSRRKGGHPPSTVCLSDPSFHLIVFGHIWALVGNNKTNFPNSPTFVNDVFFLASFLLSFSLSLFLSFSPSRGMGGGGGEESESLLNTFKNHHSSKHFFCCRSTANKEKKK